ELERLATPLLERAVAETQRVVTAAGQSPDQLAGLFLVGGSSRMPLAARLLHSQLGMAPTVLEQPEIPVAEGSLAAAFPAQRAEAPVTPPAAPPGAPQESFLEPGPPPTPWYKKKSTWIAAAAAALVVGLLGWWVLHDPYPQHDMRDQLSQVGETTPYPGGEDSAPTPYPPAIDGETAYFPTTAEEGVEVTAVDVNDGGDKWTSDPLAVEDLKEIQAANGIVVLQDQTYDSEKLVFVDPDSGKRLESVDIAEGDTIDFVGETLVRYSTGESRVYGYDSKGDEQWNVKFGELAVADKVDSWKANTEPRGSGEIDDGGFFGGDPERRVWGLDADGTVKVIDAESGDVAVEKKVASPDDKYFAYENRLFVASGTTGYTVTIYDLEEDLKQMATWKPEGGELNPQWFAVCGETRMCVLEDRDGDDTTIEGTSVFDFGESEPGDVWTSEDDLLVKNAEAAGETVKLQIWNNAEDQKVFTQLYDEDFDKLTEEDVEGEFHRIDSGSFLRYPSATEVDTTEVADVVGLGARDGKVYQLGSQPELATCAATDTKLACAGEGGFSIWKFRD
ncbi:MAG: Hsp70 family protein, partial [Stackebrandtia sp.]